MERHEQDRHDTGVESDERQAGAPPADEVRREIEEDPSLNPPETELDDVRGG